MPTCQVLLGCCAYAQGIQVGGSFEAFILTDPAVCTADQRYGKSDLGAAAISAFLEAHVCGSVCTDCGCSGASL